MEKKNIIDALDEIGFLKLGLVELISSEVLTSKEECEKALEHLERYKADFPTSKKKDDPWLKKFLANAAARFITKL